MSALEVTSDTRVFKVNNEDRFLELSLLMRMVKYKKLSTNSRLIRTLMTRQVIRHWWRRKMDYILLL